MDNKLIIALLMIITSFGRFGISSEVNGGFDYMTDIEEDSSFRIEKGSERETSENHGNYKGTIEGSRNKNDTKEMKSNHTDRLESLRGFDPPYFYFSSNKFLWKKTKETKGEEESDSQPTSKINGKKFWQWFIKKDKTATDNGKRLRGQFDVLSSTSKVSSPDQFFFVLDDEEKDLFNNLMEDETNSSIERNEEDGLTNTDESGRDCRSTTVFITPKTVKSPITTTTAPIETTLRTNTTNNTYISTQLAFVSALSGRDGVDFESLMNHPNYSNKFIHNGTLPGYLIPTFDYDIEDFEVGDVYKNATFPIKEIQITTSGKKLISPFDEGKPFQFFLSTDVNYLYNNSTAHRTTRKSFWDITDGYEEIKGSTKPQINSTCINRGGIAITPTEQLNVKVSSRENVFDPFLINNETNIFSGNHISTISSHLLMEPNGFNPAPISLTKSPNGIYIPYYKGIPPKKVIVYDFMSKKMQDFSNDNDVMEVQNNRRLKTNASANGISDPVTFSYDFTSFIKNISRKLAGERKLEEVNEERKLSNINNMMVCLNNCTNENAFNVTSEDEISDDLKEYMLLLGIVPYDSKLNEKKIKSTNTTSLETDKWDLKSTTSQSNGYKNSDDNLKKNNFTSEYSNTQITGNENFLLECVNNHSVGCEKQNFLNYENITSNVYARPENNLKPTLSPIPNFDLEIETLKFPCLKNSLGKTLIQYPTKIHE